MFFGTSLLYKYVNFCFNYFFVVFLTAVIRKLIVAHVLSLVPWHGDNPKDPQIENRCVFGDFEGE
jgi:hypothetical protein